MKIEIDTGSWLRKARNTGTNALRSGAKVLKSPAHVRLRSPIAFAADEEPSDLAKIAELSAQIAKERRVQSDACKREVDLVKQHDLLVERVHQARECQEPNIAR